MNRNRIPKRTKLEQLEEELEDLLANPYLDRHDRISSRIKTARITYLKQAIPECKLRCLLEVDDNELE